MTVEDAKVTTSVLSPHDLIPDVRLREADVDAFGHEGIAARVAELAALADVPVNIALFGAWGSGKSSFYELIRRHLKATRPEVTPIRYDAWKYGGVSLKRNFISHVANELGFVEDSDRNKKYHRGLYESSRTVDFDPLQLLGQGRWKSYIATLLFSAGVTTLGVLAAAFLSSTLGNESYFHEVGRLAPGYYKFVGTTIFAIASALRILDGARVEVQQTIPSEDERFARLLQDLVTDATKGGLSLCPKTRRLLFFVDELDRCSKPDVVATLTSLRTFLDQPDCVFVVAADREVLESALEEVEQTTPIREEEPYYSSASAFLDKIFQHQFTLPPLRGGRLTGFARDLVGSSGGLWKNLRDAEPNQKRLDDVMYALIPPHVRSPRRVKVLLNNFATNARVAEARGIDWLTRATEVAKLTVLQTEFPRLAADLYLEPRLPSLLLDPPASPSARQRVLLLRHRQAEPNEAAAARPETVGEPQASDETTYEPPDALLGDSVKSAALKGRQQEDLFRYLRSRAAASVPDPARDLLYLEAAGRVTGLEDVELSQLLEDEAPNDPEAAINELKRRAPHERLAAARLLGHMSEREFGTERSNIMTTLAGALEDLAPTDLTGATGDLRSNVAGFCADEEPRPGHVVGMLTLALATDAQDDLRQTLLRNPSLVDSPERLAKTASLLPFLTDVEAKPIEVAVVEAYPHQQDVLLACVRTQDAKTVARLLRSSRETLVRVLKPPGD